jgi:hypothetical protein
MENRRRNTMWVPRLWSAFFMVAGAVLAHLSSAYVGLKPSFIGVLCLIWLFTNICVAAGGFFGIVISFGVEPVSLGKFRPRKNALGQFITRITNPEIPLGYCATSYWFGFLATILLVCGAIVMVSVGYTLYDPVAMWALLLKILPIVLHFIMGVILLVLGVSVMLAALLAPFFVGERFSPIWGWALGIVEMGVVACIIYTYGPPPSLDDVKLMFEGVSAIVLALGTVILAVVGVKYLPGYRIWLCPELTLNKRADKKVV